MTRYLWRWLILIGVAAVAFHESVDRTLSWGSATSVSYSVATVVMALVMFLGIELQRRTDLPIHDREVDWIIGLLALVLSVSLRIVLAPRLIEWFDLLRLDILSFFVFLFGASTLLFGTRFTLRFGLAWIVLLMYSSPVFLVVTLLCGGGWTGAGYATTVGVAVATVVAAGGSLRCRAVAGTVVAVVGGVLTFLTGRVIIDEDTVGAASLTVLPALVGVTVAVLLDAWVRRTRPTVRRQAPSVGTIRLAVVPILGTAVILAVVPLPDRLITSVTADAPGADSDSVGVPVPVGWSQIGEETFDWADRYFGAGTVLSRQKLRADTVVADWDEDGRYREVVVDTLVPGSGVPPQRFGDESFYDSVSGRRSPKIDVDLGHGVTGNVHTVFDENNFLTYTHLRFSWRGEDPADDSGNGNTGPVHYVSVIAVDDHRASARFPEFTDSLNGLAGRIVTVLLRGGAVTEDASATYKDLDLVTSVGRGIIDARWTGAEVAS
ncbi:hypothetical protein [Corynebacterium terpenotabidum]|uniref:Uncharacterized protein n=1 Tax=Corynebacterium terpenotabidum Y-11 TaxID=1200352 RepID=S4XHY9_9CORY|nr:hypothetical protein [Corynebacterium terpenotabidum]AGP30238.1 hypothetical protein A606_02925 [Corynebacterium terpenotabidum Y-11]